MVQLYSCVLLLLLCVDVEKCKQHFPLTNNYNNKKIMCRFCLTNKIISLKLIFIVRRRLAEPDVNECEI